MRTASGHASAWNSAGTFEEKNWTSWAKERLTHLLVATEASVGGVTLRVVEISAKGDATVAVVRGKPRHGFDFELEMKWVSEMAGEADVKGTTTILEASSDTVTDGELAVEVKVDGKGGGAAAAAAKSAAGSSVLRKAVLAKLTLFEKEMRERLQQQQ